METTRTLTDKELNRLSEIHRIEIRLFDRIEDYQKATGLIKQNLFFECKELQYKYVTTNMPTE